MVAKSGGDLLDKRMLSGPLEAVDMKKAPFACICLNLRLRAEIMVVRL